MNIQTACNIAENSFFQARIRYLMVKKALAELADSPTQPDTILGQRILDGTETVMPWALAALTNATIMAGAHTQDGASIADNDLEFSLNSCWTVFTL